MNRRRQGTRVRPLRASRARPSRCGAGRPSFAPRRCPGAGESAGAADREGFGLPRRGPCAGPCVRRRRRCVRRGGAAAFRMHGKRWPGRADRAGQRQTCRPVCESQRDRDERSTTLVSGPPGGRWARPAKTTSSRSRAPCRALRPMGSLGAKLGDAHRSWRRSRHDRNPARYHWFSRIEPCPPKPCRRWSRSSD